MKQVCGDCLHWKEAGVMKADKNTIGAIRNYFETQGEEQ